jgi:hypothetical protein
LTETLDSLRFSPDVVDGVVAHLPLNSCGAIEIRKLGEKRVN